MKKNKSWILWVIILFLSDLVILYYIKYKNQLLPISNFTLNNTGNILNLIFTLLLISGLIIYFFKKDNVINASSIISLSIIMTVLLLVSFITTLIEFPWADFYLFGQPFSRILIVGIFFIFQFIQIILISILWLSLFNRKKYLTLRALVDSAAIILAALVIAYLHLNFQMNNYKKSKLDKTDGNIAVVLGAAVWSDNEPSPSLAARADKAAELYKKSLVDKIILTGSNAPGELSEAEVAYNYIKKNVEDIDTSNVLVEKKSRSTSEQVRFIKEELLKNYNIKRVIIVSDLYHLPRVEEISRFFHVKSKVVASDLSLSFENKMYYKLRESIALLSFWFFAI